VREHPERPVETPDPDSAGAPLWSARFSSPPAPAAYALGESLHFDIRLAPQDVAAGIAHVHALAEAGLVSPEESREIGAALSQIGAEIAAGRLVFGDADEDVHSAVERALIARLGETGSRLHAGRSRNDLVVTDLRLWMIEASERLTISVIGLIHTLVGRARDNAGSVMPGTTHGRLAQPVTLGHHLLAHTWALLRDLDRIDQWADRTSTSALGAGAIATSTLGLDPVATAVRLGMRRAFANSIDAVGDRDFVQEFLAVAAICATHLSRLAADLARWTDESLSWAELDEAYSTGSSMMPQKRNPDTAELVRAKAARITGDLVAVNALLQGLPLGYHRDLQEDKDPVFDAVDTLELVLPALAGAVGTVRFDIEAMRAACLDGGLYATDLAEALVRSGVAFRDAHRRTGALLKGLAEQGRTLGDLTQAEWADFGVPHGAELLDPDASVSARWGHGGPSQASVLAQADAIDAALAARTIA
jgi:argininosuccinate lyase